VNSDRKLLALTNERGYDRVGSQEDLYPSASACLDRSDDCRRREVKCESELKTEMK
jgi:hypothetical protein